MPDLTPANRDRARRALIASGYPIGDDGDHLERLRRTELLEAVATVDALAEQRGRHTPPSDVLRDRLAAAWDEGYAAAAGDPEDPSTANPYVLADIGGPLDTDEPQPDEDTAAARRADRMTWTPGDLQITPPPDAER